MGFGPVSVILTGTFGLPLPLPLATDRDILTLPNVTVAPLHLRERERVVYETLHARTSKLGWDER